MERIMKNIITPLLILTQMLIYSSANASCNLELIRFGSSPEKVQKEFPEVLPMLGGADAPQSMLSIPGELACKSEKSFVGAPVQYLFLYGELVEINITRLSDSPRLLGWVESVYGEKIGKPDSLYSDEPNGQLIWDTFNSVVLYSYTTNGDDRIEDVSIQSRRHELLYQRFAKEEEKALESGEWPWMKL